ncbi:unnamed protein product, partial [Rotaria sordida]
MASSLQYSAHKSSSKENGQYKAKHKTKNYQFLPQGESTRIDEDKKIPSDTNEQPPHHHDHHHRITKQTIINLLAQ